jgi:hypothetical protein
MSCRPNQGLHGRGLLAAVVMLFTCSAIHASVEAVIVKKVMDDKAVVVRSNSETYLIETGVGCLSLWRFEKKRVYISSPGLFLGIGSRLLIPDVDQECKVWTSESLGSSNQSSPFSLQTSLSPADEMILYSSSGKPVAYIADEDDLTIFLWSGTPVAYLHGDDVYGFNGKHLGWFKSGALFDHDGAPVGALKSRFRAPVEIAPVKSRKKIKPIKSIREIAPIRPILTNTWSDDSFSVFLLQGAK